ncbi:hypothetical protein ABEG18_03495 [Alsobacter sp. KACC 23698]|uniref:Uncharacterized protein n=1 Tax=Alsobacter sp. KACC 23698 TaxID=3149229 RepID=A0AAU7JHG3_9HYPH
MLQRVRRRVHETAQQTQHQRSEQAEQRARKARRHADQGRLEIVDQPLDGLGRCGIALRQPADDAADGAHHLHEADEGADQPEEDAEAGQVAHQGPLVRHAGVNRGDQVLHGGDGDAHVPGAEQLVQRQREDMPQQLRRGVHDPRDRAALQLAFVVFGRSAVALGLDVVIDVLERSERFHVVAQTQEGADRQDRAEPEDPDDDGVQVRVGLDASQDEMLLPYDQAGQQKVDDGHASGLFADDVLHGMALRGGTGREA